MATLKEKLWPVAKEYARQTADLLGIREYHFVGINNEGKGTIDVCDFDGSYMFSLEEMQTIIDDLDKWVARYGSREAVAQEVMDWQDWWLRDGTDEPHPLIELWENRQERSLRTHPRINLSHWLMGCPREPRPKTPHDLLRELKVKRECIRELIDQYRQARSLWNIFDSLTTDIDRQEKICRQLDEQAREQFRKDHADLYADLEQACAEEQQKQE